MQVDLVVELLETLGHVDSFQGTSLAIADCLLLLLDNIPDPIIPQSFHQLAFHAAAASDVVATQRLIGELPEDARMILREVMGLSHRMLAASTSSIISSTTVADVLAPVLLRPTSLAEQHATQFMVLLLENEELKSLWR